MPSRYCPELDTFIEWIYVIDLDQNILRVYAQNDPFMWDTCGIQYFRLDNIPRWLFDLEEIKTDSEWRVCSVYPIITATEETVPLECWANYVRDIPKPKTELLDFYHSLSHQTKLSIAPAAHSPTWRRLQILLLGQFVEYFLRSFHDVCPSRKSSPFIVRQLAYAVLCLLQPGGTAGMKFHGTVAPHKLFYGWVRGGIQTPSWEPPDSDSYWLGNVLIVLDEHIYDHSDYLAPISKAAIAKTVQLACAADTGSDPDVVAVIFSIHCIFIVKVHKTPDGPVVSHTANLPLLSCIGDIGNALGALDMRILKRLKYSTVGIQALMSVFASRVPAQRQSGPANLPTELCQQIFQSADPKTQNALEGSCRLFRDIAAQHPRIGEWTLLKCSGDTNFIGIQSSTQSEHVVALRPMNGRHRSRRPNFDTSGFEVGLWGCDEKLQLNMQLFTIEEVVPGPKEKAVLRMAV